MRTRTHCQPAARLDTGPSRRWGREPPLSAGVPQSLTASTSPSQLGPMGTRRHGEVHKTIEAVGAHADPPKQPVVFCECIAQGWAGCAPLEHGDDLAGQRTDGAQHGVDAGTSGGNRGDHCGGVAGCARVQDDELEWGRGEGVDGRCPLTLAVGHGTAKGTDGMVHARRLPMEDGFDLEALFVEQRKGGVLAGMGLSSPKKSDHVERDCEGSAVSSV